MSQEQIERLRPVLAEWAKGNLWAVAGLLAPDVTFYAGMPASFVAHGPEQTTRLVLDFLSQWSTYRIETDEVEDLGEDNILVTGRQSGKGKVSGAETDFPIFVVWRFRGAEVVGVYLEGTRDAAIEAAGLGD
jgi:SnoaL-like domain